MYKDKQQLEDCFFHPPSLLECYWNLEGVVDSEVFKNFAIKRREEKDKRKHFAGLWENACGRETEAAVTFRGSGGKNRQGASRSTDAWERDPREGCVCVCVYWKRGGGSCVRTVSLLPHC